MSDQQRQRGSGPMPYNYMSSGHEQTEVLDEARGGGVFRGV
jgi:hypothetical protein